IARPFVGKGAGQFMRTGNRHDLSLPPPSTTVLQKLVEEKNGEVISIGKIADIYADCGITKKIKANGLEQLTDATISAIKDAGDNSLIFTNFVDFDSHYGHRRDVAGYAAAIEYFDRRLPEILAHITPDDLLIITADHGCDPTWEGSDHTREHIPVLMQNKALGACSIGGRETFADIGQTIATYFKLTPMDYGKSVL
ncbi:MAG: phosphopentomutase, partial [Vibrionaceae bacterium]